MTERIHTGPLKIVGPDGETVEVRERGEGLKPVFLLADSQLLFWSERGEPFLARVLAHVDSPTPKAAYLGASNGDEPAFYEIFTAAMEGAGVRECRMIPSVPSDEDLAFLEEADLLLLAGGDVERGWRAFQAGGVREVVERRWGAGAVLVGVSAGAVQLGLVGWREGAPEASFPTFGVVPLAVSAHDESGGWEGLRRVVAAHGGSIRGVGVPRGGGVIYHSDHAVEAIRHPALEVEMRGGEVAVNLLLPVPA